MSFIKQTFQCNLRTERLTKNHYCNENINTITSLNSSGPLNYSSACLKHFLLVQRAHELVTWKHRCIIFLMCKLSVVTYARQLLTFKIRDSVQQNTHFFSVCYLKHNHSHFSTYQTGVFSWQPHTSLQGTVKQTKAWASQQPFWSIQPSSFLLYKTWWLFVVNYVFPRKAQQVLTFYGYILLQRHLKTGHHSGYTNFFFSLLYISLSEQLGVNKDHNLSSEIINDCCCFFEYSFIVSFNFSLFNLKQEVWHMLVWMAIPTCIPGLSNIRSWLYMPL